MAGVAVSLFHVDTQESKLTEIPLLSVTLGSWGLSRDQIPERLKSLDLILRARGISAFNAFCSIQASRVSRPKETIQYCLGTYH